MRGTAIRFTTAMHIFAAEAAAGMGKRHLPAVIGDLGVMAGTGVLLPDFMAEATTGAGPSAELSGAAIRADFPRVEDLASVVAEAVDSMAEAGVGGVRI